MFVTAFSHELNEHLAPHRSANKVIGFVATMGALHAGHLSLIEQAAMQCDVVVVSIFVNPTQFDQEEDLTNYPKSIDKDLEFLNASSCDVVFTPSVKEMYPEGAALANNIDFGTLTRVLEAVHRPGHFQGVATIVKILFDIVKPDKAFFGEKDLQQLRVIQHLCHSDQITVDIIGCPTVREEDGLAFSSRNVKLTETQRPEASLLYRVLQKAKRDYNNKNLVTSVEEIEKAFSEHDMFELDYFSINDSRTLKPLSNWSDSKHPRAFVAAYLGNVRLIDNMSLNN